MDAAISLMLHPANEAECGGKGFTGIAGKSSITHLGLEVTFTGRNAHAEIEPWKGINALDAIVSAYNNISMLRQQMRPEERVHGCIMESPKISNVIPILTKVLHSVRSPSQEGTRALWERERKFTEAAAMARGCVIEIEEEYLYADLRLGHSLCQRYATQMHTLGEDVVVLDREPIPASTDQGNVSYAVPQLYASMGIPCPPDVTGPHTPGFAAAAQTKEAFERALRAAKALAMVGWDVMTDDALYESVKNDFERRERTEFIEGLDVGVTFSSCR